MEFVIRKANTADIPAMLELARSVGRMISPEEIQTWMRIDKDAFSIAETTCETKEIVGICFGVRPSSQEAFIGLYIVKEEFRGLGLGSKLWNSAMEYVGEECNIGINGVEPLFWKYKNDKGFKYVADYQIAYFNYLGPTKELHVQNLLSSGVDDVETGRNTKIYEVNVISLFEGQMTTSNVANGMQDGNCKTIKYILEEGNVKFHSDSAAAIGKSIAGFTVDDILNKVVAYDQDVNNRYRTLLLKETFAWNSCRTKIALVSGKVVGYGCLRPVISGHWLISPFYADSHTIAEVLLVEMLKDFDCTKALKGIEIRFPDKNIPCKELLSKYGFRDTDVRVLTGYTKYCKTVDIRRIYSFHSVVFCNE